MSSSDPATSRHPAAGKRLGADRTPEAPLRVLGIDPGIANLGLGVVEELRREARLVGSVTVKTSARQAQTQRLLHLRGELVDYIELHRPQVIAIEGQYFHRQREVSFKVGQAVGVVLLSAAELDLPVFEYGPMQVKQALVGNGRADKAQVAFMVRALLKLPAELSSNHAADAVALALTHLQSRRVSQLGAKS